MYSLEHHHHQYDVGLDCRDRTKTTKIVSTTASVAPKSRFKSFLKKKPGPSFWGFAYQFVIFFTEEEIKRIAKKVTGKVFRKNIK